jgi:hypothetical protein
VSANPGDRPPRSSSLAPGGIIVLVLAIVFGLLILGKGLKPSSSSSHASTTTTLAPITTTTTPTGATTTLPAGTTTTTVANPAPGAKVIVANAAGVGGVAGCLTNDLKKQGFVTVPPTNATAHAAATVVYYASGQQANAQKVATAVGVKTAPKAMPTKPPVASLGGANVLVELAKDLAHTC